MEGHRELMMFVPITIVYALLAVLFYFLYSKFNRYVVFGIAPVLGLIMEFTFMRPQENDINVVTNPFYSAIFFIVIWPIILIPPYFITKFISRPARKREK
jgi:hypothetical protein